jgi:hypothetical protein
LKKVPLRETLQKTKARFSRTQTQFSLSGFLLFPLSLSPKEQKTKWRLAAADSAAAAGSGAATSRNRRSGKRRRRLLVVVGVPEDSVPIKGVEVEVCLVNRRVESEDLDSSSKQGAVVWVDSGSRNRRLRRERVSVVVLRVVIFCFVSFFFLFEFDSIRFLFAFFSLSRFHRERCFLARFVV